MTILIFRLPSSAEVPYLSFVDEFYLILSDSSLVFLPEDTCFISTSNLTLYVAHWPCRGPFPHRSQRRRHSRSRRLIERMSWIIETSSDSKVKSARTCPTEVQN